MEHQPGSRNSEAGRASPTTVLGDTFDTKDPRRGRLAYLRALRPHQWVKNTLVLLPAVVAGRLTAENLLEGLLPAFAAFSLLASGVYVVNDILDLETDRAHPRKRLRPFASGEIPVRHGYWMAPLLFLSGLALAASLGPATFVIAAAYVALTTIYSLWLKHVFLVDVCTLSSLYTLRVAAGASSIGIPLSGWLAAFSIAFFMSLAAVKRMVELTDAPESARPAGSGHGYVGRNRALVERLAIGSGALAIVILTIYFGTVPSVALFDVPAAKWAVCVLLSVWLGRIILAARRGAFEDDPVSYALTDWVSWACLGAIALLAVLA